MQTLSSLTSRLEQQQQANALVQWALARDSRLAADPVTDFVRRAGVRFVPLVKTAVEAMRSDDPGILGPLVTGFLAMVERDSVDGQIPGLVRVPLTDAGRIQIATAIGSTVGETAPKPISRLDFAFVGPVGKVAATVIMTAELMRSADPVTQEMIRRQVVSAVVAAKNAALVAALTAGAPTAASTVWGLFAQVSAGSPRYPVLLAGFDAIGTLPSGTVRDLQAIGVVILSAPEAQGLLIACDGGGILLSEDPVQVATAQHASIEMDDAPSGGGFVSLWQQNLIGLRGEQFARIGIRPDAAAWMAVGTP